MCPVAMARIIVRERLLMNSFATLAKSPARTRRRVLASLTMGAALLMAPCAFAAEHLRILAWPGYADPDLVADFERLAGISVQVSYVHSDDELWDKIRNNNGADYDLFAVNTAELQRYIDGSLVAPIDLRSIPNLENQSPRFRKFEAIPGIVRNNLVYAIPYTYSEMGLIYNRKLVKQPPQSIGALWDPAYRGRVLAHNTSNHNFSLAGLMLGVQNPFRLTPAEFRVTAKKLVELRRNVRTFYGSPEEVVKLYRENEIALVYANYGTQQLKALQQAGADVGYVIPREGALAWLDCWAVTRGARNRATAERWINYTLEKSVSAALTTRQGLANTITPPADSSQKDKIIWLEPLEDFAKRNALWNRILSGDGPEKF